MISRVARLNGDESAAAGCRHFVVGYQLAFDDGAVGGRFDYARDQMYWLVRRGWPQEFDGVLSSDGAGRMIETVPFHQIISGSPIAVAVEHGACDATAQHSRKCLLVALGLPVSNNLLAGREAANVQALFVCWAAAKTLEVWRVGFLDAFLGHCRLVTEVFSCFAIRCDWKLPAAFICRLRRLHKFKQEQQQLLRGSCRGRTQLLPKLEALHFAGDSVRQLVHENVSAGLLETWQGRASERSQIGFKVVAAYSCLGSHYKRAGTWQAIVIEVFNYGHATNAIVPQ